LPLQNRELWIATAKGVWRWNEETLTRSGVPSSLLQVEVFSMLRDRDLNIWVGTNRGLQRINANGLSSPGGTNILNYSVTALFEDREGNIWIGGPRGLERLRETAVITFAFPGLGSQSMGPLYADENDRIWFAPIGGGLQWLNGSTAKPLQIAGLNHDVVYSITGQSDDLWVGRQRGGLTNLRSIHGALTAKTYTEADGLAQNSVYAVYQSRDRTIWAGTLNGGVSKLRNGDFTTYTTSNGLASDTVSSIAEDADGTMWF